MDELLIKNLSNKGDVILDAGANIGYTAAKFVLYGASEVYCFEPVSSVFEKLEKIKHHAVFAFNEALSNRDNYDYIYVSSNHNQGSSLKKEFLEIFPNVFAKNNPVTEKIKLTKLDSKFPTKKFDYMKIDIEGSEMDFLEGARFNIENHTPRIIQIESYPTKFESVHSFLKYFFKYYKRINISKNNGIFISDIDSKHDVFDSTDNYLYYNQIDHVPNGQMI